MNVIQRICEKYPIEYSLMPDFRMRSVSITFDPRVPENLQDKILEGLDCLGVLVEDMGMPMSVNVSQEKPGCYTLAVVGQELFHFSAYPNVPFAGYDVAEAIIWTVYIQAGSKDWLDAYRGKYISCRCFSARQQAAAIQISSSVNRQYQGSISEEQLHALFLKLRGYVDPFVSRAPLFSARPIAEAMFDRFKGHPVEASLQQIAERLFGTASFDDEIEEYCRMVQSSTGYQQYLEDAVQKLQETAYQLPIMAVGHLFTELGTLIDEIEPANSAVYRRLLQETVRFSLSAASLKESFGEVDAAYLQGVRASLEIAFLRDVCDQAHARISKEFAEAKRGITQLRNALSRFCFVSPESFEQGSGMGTLSWKQLSSLSDRDVYSKNVYWTPESFNDLQSTMLSAYAPQLWICSEKLRNQSEFASITDLLITKSAPIMDERLVWAIWVDV